MDIPYVDVRKHRDSNIEKCKAMGRREVKKKLITSFISSGSSKDMNIYQIARAAKVDTTDAEMMKHINIMLKRHEARLSK